MLTRPLPFNNNPMYDPRVVRGNTYAAVVTSKISENPPKQPAKKAVKALAQKKTFVGC